jgi:hypothetical protein
VRNFSTIFVLLGSTPATKKVYLHIQKVESAFYNSKQVTYTCRYISGVLANPSLGNLALPATVAQGQPKSPVVQLHTDTGSRQQSALAPLTCRSVSIYTPTALSEIHKDIPKVPKHKQIWGRGTGVPPAKILPALKVL